RHEPRTGAVVDEPPVLHVGEDEARAAGGPARTAAAASARRERADRRQGREPDDAVRDAIQHALLQPRMTDDGGTPDERGREKGATEPRACSARSARSTSVDLSVISKRIGSLCTAPVAA